MSYKVAAFYQFVALPDFEALREPLRNMCVALDVRGIILLAAEGINGTVAGREVSIDALMNQLQKRHSQNRPQPKHQTSQFTKLLKKETSKLSNNTWLLARMWMKSMVT